MGAPWCRDGDLSRFIHSIRYSLTTFVDGRDFQAVEMHATRRIDTGEELLVDYGKDAVAGFAQATIRQGT